MSYFDFFFQNKNNETFNIYTGIQLYMFQNIFIKDDFFGHIPFFFGFFHIDNMIKNYFWRTSKVCKNKGPNVLNYTWRYQMCFLDERVQGF